jgi:tetratricopeptide (TPR) repeat protein
MRRGAGLRGFHTVAWPLLACLLLPACGSPPAKPKPAPASAAIEANRRAEAQLRAGDLEGAARGYSEALRAAQSLEDADGIAANAVNLSIVYQRLGKLRDARASLAPVLGQANLNFAPERLAQAALRRSLIDLDERRYASAAEWAERAESHCERSCALSAAIHNVKGQLALESGRYDAAAASALRALDASRASGDRAEAANALRLLGISAVHSGDTAAAHAHIADALETDRDLAVPRKIWLDLLWLGRIDALRGERDSARAYYERALAVSEAERDAKASAEARALIDALGSTVSR